MIADTSGMYALFEGVNRDGVYVIAIQKVIGWDSCGHALVVGLWGKCAQIANIDTWEKLYGADFKGYFSEKQYDEIFDEYQHLAETFGKNEAIDFYVNGRGI